MQTMKVRAKKEKGVKGSVGSPMPGEILNVKVGKGDEVKVGDTLAVISAMKMETIVKAPVGGVVKELLISVGDKLEGDDLMLEIE